MKKSCFITKICALLLAVLMCASLLVSCGASSKADDHYGGADYNSAPSKGESIGSNGNGIGNIPSGGIDNPSAKIIKTANAEMSTTEYDSFLENLYAKITEFSGYTDGESFGGSGKYRYASITVRIPADKLEAFKEALTGMGTMNYYSAKKQDVTLTYDMLKAEVDTLTAEIVIVEALFEIAKENGDLSEITEIEEKLTDLRLRIAKANAQLSVYDNSIAYSTVYLSVSERAVIEEPEPEPDPTAFQRIGTNLKRAFTGILNFFVDLFVFIVSAIPYLLVIALFAAIPVSVIIARHKKKKKENDTKKEEE